MTPMRNVKVTAITYSPIIKFTCHLNMGNDMQQAEQLFCTISYQVKMDPCQSHLHFILQWMWKMALANKCVSDEIDVRKLYLSQGDSSWWILNAAISNTTLIYIISKSKRKTGKFVGDFLRAETYLSIFQVALSLWLCYLFMLVFKMFYHHFILPLNMLKTELIEWFIVVW